MFKKFLRKYHPWAIFSIALVAVAILQLLIFGVGKLLEPMSVVFTSADLDQRREIVINEDEEITLINNSTTTILYVYVDGFSTDVGWGCQISGSRQIIGNTEKTWQQISLDPGCQTTLKANIPSTLTISLGD